MTFVLHREPSVISVFNCECCICYHKSTLTSWFFSLGFSLDETTMCMCFIRFTIKHLPLLEIISLIDSLGCYQVVHSHYLHAPESQILRYIKVPLLLMILVRSVSHPWLNWLPFLGGITAVSIGWEVKTQRETISQHYTQSLLTPLHPHTRRSLCFQMNTACVHGDECGALSVLQHFSSKIHPGKRYNSQRPYTLAVETLISFLGFAFTVSLSCPLSYPQVPQHPTYQPLWPLLWTRFLAGRLPFGGACPIFTSSLHMRCAHVFYNII